ncbi:MAG: MFS transporter [Rhodobacteraceae bacterium]|nr:MFS transporter [Paracoccaceae bacterium]
MERLPDFLRNNAGWLAAGALLSFSSSFGQTFFISVFAGEIRGEYGLTHGEWGAIYSLATMASAAVMVFAGGVTDRFRVRWIGLAVYGGLALAALVMAGAHSVWALWIAVFLLRLMGQGMMSHTAYTAMARWFVASRGAAVAVAGIGIAVGEALLPLIFVALMGVFGWRALWVGVALALVLLAPLLWRLLRTERTPQSFASDPGGEGMEGRMWSRGDMLRHWLFWAMLPAILGPPMWNTAFFFHQVHIAEVKGWGHPALVALFPVYTAAAVGAMVLSGGLIDRFGSGRLAGVYLLPLAAGYAVFALVGGVPAGAVALVLIGVSVGVHNTMAAAFWAEHYGTRHIGTIRAATGAVMVLGTAVGPVVTGALIDRGLSFPGQALGIAAYFVAASGLAGLGAARAGRLLPRVSAPA